MKYTQVKMRCATCGEEGRYTKLDIVRRVVPCGACGARTLDVVTDVAKARIKKGQRAKLCDNAFQHKHSQGAYHGPFHPPSCECGEEH